ncbi:hypothetical protein [Ensifer soli]|uniref:hypothetical protein n=1 Tax=Ciceribacter sp. sgz301302 TaxID=3342379 RepID=UPI0035B9F53A
MRCGVVAVVMAGLVLAAPAFAFDAGLSKSVKSRATAEIRACGDGKCTAAALKKAAGRFSDRPDYRSVAVALNGVARAVGACAKTCEGKKAEEVKSLVSGYRAEIAGAGRSEIKTLASIFDPSIYKVLR